MDRVKALKARRSELENASQNARSFLKLILDDLSFVELDAFVSQDALDGSPQGEGVITGFGRVLDNDVYIFCQNIEALKGGVGKLHADKIVKCMLKASDADIPLISVIDTMGARLEEGVDILESYAEILGAASRLTVPHIMIIKSSSYGMISALAGIADFVLMEQDAVMASTSPKILAASQKEVLKDKEIGGAEIWSKNGLVDFVGSKEQIAELVKKLVTYIYNDSESEDDLNRVSSVLNTTDDIYTVINETFDKGSFIECGAAFAPSAVCGLALMDGVTVGVIAHNFKADKYLDQNALKKISKYVRVFDALEIPVVNFVNTLGLKADLDAERGGLLEEAARVISAYANFGGTLISVIIGSAAGFGYTAFASNGVGYDYKLAWANADISPLPVESLAVLEKREEIKKANLSEKTEQEFEKIIQEYSDQKTDAFFAARKGYIDEVIEPALTRSYLIAALRMTENA
ncbi:MAG TPA: carboxyl transferase domain-containing protein [Clostridia bacterium]